MKTEVILWERSHMTKSGGSVYRFVVRDVATGEIYAGKTRPNAGFIYGIPANPKFLHDVIINKTPGGRVYMDGCQP